MDLISGVSGYGSGSLYEFQTSGVSSSTSAKALENTLQNADLDQASDEELMDVCKSFESYFVEQVLKEAKNMVKSEDEESQYLQYFGDTLVQEYADMITDQGDLGIAQTLYDSMKRNGA